MISSGSSSNRTIRIPVRWRSRKWRVRRVDDVVREEQRVPIVPLALLGSYNKVSRDIDDSPKPLSAYPACGLDAGARSSGMTPKRIPAHSYRRIPFSRGSPRLPPILPLTWGKPRRGHRHCWHYRVRLSLVHHQTVGGSEVAARTGAKFARLFRKNRAGPRLTFEGAMPVAGSLRPASVALNTRLTSIGNFTDGGGNSQQVHPQLAKTLDQLALGVT